MRLSSFPFWEVILRLNTAGPQVGSSMLSRARERTLFTEAFMNFYATALWMREISLTPAFRRSSGINSAVPSEGRFGRTGPLVSPIMKDFVSHWVLRRLIPCLQRQRGKVCFRQDPWVYIRQSGGISRHLI